MQFLLAAAMAGCGGGGGSGGGGGGPTVSDDATLSSLAVSAGTLSPAFASATVSYAVSIPNGTATVTVTPTTHHGSASVAVRQDAGAFGAVTSGQASPALSVPAVGSSSTITVRVTAEDGTTARNYTIALTQKGAVLSSDAALAGLRLSASATLSPAFAASVYGYTAAAPNGTASVTVTPTARDPNASIQVRQGSGAFGPVASGSASGPLDVPAVGSTSIITIRVTAQDGTTTQDYTLTLSQLGSGSHFTIYSIGDSTMADYDPVAYPNQRGWGQMFPQFLIGADVTFANAAKNGRSSKSFYTEGSWAAVAAGLHPGDYVFIQFAHNDEKNGGLEGVAGTANEVGTAPFPATTDPVASGDYQVYLRKYVDETVAAGATPILFTPVVRRYFSGASVTAKGSHDLTAAADHDASITDGRDLNYVEAMKAVATEKGCAIIDMTASTKQLVEQFGPTDSKSLLYISTDDTHLQPLGAMMFAQLAVQELISKGILADHLNPAADLVVSPAALDYGSLYIGLTQTKAITITGLSLTPDSGNVTVTAPTGFAVSASATGAFAAALQLPYTGGKLAPTTVYVQFQPGAEQAYSGNVTATPDSGSAKSVAVTGTGVAVPSGGTESSAVWSLISDATCAANGLVTCAAETFSELYVKSYAIPSATSTTWNPSQPTSTITQRLSILNSTTPDQWPGSEIDIIPARFVQFTVSPAAGKRFAIDAISLWAGAAGGNNMGYRIQYSKQADFGTAVTLLDSPSNVSYAMILQSFTPIVTVEDGETLYVRVFPWYKGTPATGKYLCLQTLTIHGTAL